MVTLAFSLAPAFAADIDGTEGPDEITPTSSPTPTTEDRDVVDAGDGDDYVEGAGGNDDLYGGSDASEGGDEDVDGGDDRLNGGAGNDDVYGGDGNDTINGDAGDDELFGGPGADTISGGPDNDTIYGDDPPLRNVDFSCVNIEICTGQGNFNLSDFTAAALDGTPNDDNLAGGGGDDFIFGGYGNDTVNGDAGNDHLYGEDGDDTLFGGTDDDFLSGGWGNDILCGGDGTDVLNGDDGDDVACAHDDAATVTSGAATTFDVTANDEELSDECFETNYCRTPLVYEIFSVTDGITATIDPVTGLLTFAATKSGVIRYSVTRPRSCQEACITAIDGTSTFADLIVSVLPIITPPQIPPAPQAPHDDDDDDDQSDDDDDDDNDQPVFASPVFFEPPLTDEEPLLVEPPTAPEHHETTTPPVTKATGWPLGRSAAGGSAFLTLMIMAAVIAALGRNGGIARTSAQRMAFADRDEETAAREVALRDAEGPGDKSFTWRFPGHKLVDGLSLSIPDKLSPFSPLVGRLADDGSELRAMFGSLWVLAPIAGIGLGVAAAAQTGGQAVPPSVWFIIAVAVLTTFDAFAGTLAALVFGGWAVLSGGLFDGTGPDFVHSLLVVLALCFLWMAIPLIGSALRPFRRLGDGSVRHWWDTAGDATIAALLCGWVSQKLTQAMDLFAGEPTGLPEHANTVAIAVMAAVALRIGIEHFSSAIYPRRLHAVEAPGEPPPPMLWSAIGGAFLRTAVFGFVGWSFIGSCWQLWLGVLVFLIPQLIQHLRDRTPTVGPVHRLLPRGIVEIFILIVACTLAARFALNSSPDQLTAIRWAFLLIALPPAIIGAAALFTHDDTGKPGWKGEILGALVLIATTVLALQGWDY